MWHMGFDFFRQDGYGRGFYYEDAVGKKQVPFCLEEQVQDGIHFSAKQQEQNGLLQLTLCVWAEQETPLEALGFWLGVDTYMDSYPRWNDVFFPTALRCEKQGFWSCFITPKGRLLGVCSPDAIVSWRNAYNKLDSGDVGHRIYTSGVDFINQKPQPGRHPESPKMLTKQPLTFTLYYFLPKTIEELFATTEALAGIHVPLVSKFTLEPWEQPMIDGKAYDGVCSEGLSVIAAVGQAEVTLYRRKPWDDYLKAADRSAGVCQQKPGDHTESWYGYFSRVGQAKLEKDPAQTKALCAEFDGFLKAMTQPKEGRLVFLPRTDPWRLQNISQLLSLLADFYELTEDVYYLDLANDFAEDLMQTQSADGSYRCGKIHYTCVIYPAKSMLELALAEKQAGLTKRFETHWQSGCAAIDNLLLLMDNIETEGEMTFEDGMISCSALQMGFLATLLPRGEYRDRLTEGAEQMLAKHRCLEQQILPDCRTRGCTSRYWEARYDLNFFENMLNTPHAWTSWKTYATYYLYVLTGKMTYLKDTMDTLGACMQCVDENGVLRWGFVADPCVTGLRLKEGSTRDNVQFYTSTVGEEYLPMISDWWRQEEGELPNQYLRSFTDPEIIQKDFGGSCDNDVHEHFKCLLETVFAKAFVHLEKGESLCYNCRPSEGGYVTDDKWVQTWCVYSDRATTLCLGGKNYDIRSGIQCLEQ